MAKIEPTVLDHLEWLGFVQPTGLVVSPHALVTAGAILDRRDTEGHALLRSAAGLADSGQEQEPRIRDFREFARTVLGWSWSPKGFAGTEECPLPDELKLYLNEFDVTLEPTFAVRERDPGEGESNWQLLVSEVDADMELDDAISDKRFEASPHGRLERLLRHTGVPAGLLTNGRTIRLVSAPKGESSGWLDFHVPDMVTPAGRPLSTAMRMLLNQHRLLALPKDKRLAALLTASRKFQNQVSERLSEQVLHALYELLRGIQAADAARGGSLLEEPLARDPNIVYRALLTVLLRLIFLLYAEERDMLPQDEAFLKYYSLTGLHARLREDAALHPDTMSQRFGAWAQLLVLFRMIYDGAETAEMDLPPRHGELFDPDRFPFLEGRAASSSHEASEVPLVSDGTVFQVLESLLVLDGERLSYRTLDVEQIGSVYETLMGFQLETTTGRSVAIRAQARNGAPTVINLEELAEARPNDRKKWLEERLDRKLTARVLGEVQSAESVTELHSALQGVVDDRATPDLVPGGYLVLQPSDERRRSGSHYTPRELTEPIVRRALEPILHRLAEAKPKGIEPEAVLNIKVCDPAMGSGAFLVEACRQLGNALIDAWDAYDQTPYIPADEDLVTFARRLVAQKCLYGVDRNPVAVDLAKVSLWLSTLAREHSFTFLDHALRHGDSLVGLSLKQLEAFHWEDTQSNFAGLRVDHHLEKARGLRELIRTANDEVTEEQLRAWWHDSSQAIEDVRLYGDMVIHAFFRGRNQRERRRHREEYAASVLAGSVAKYARILKQARLNEPPLAPFHWEIEFPEVFDRTNPGFDVFVGNPPFLGSKQLGRSEGSSWIDFTKHLLPEVQGKTDLVAYFFLRAFHLLRHGGTLGFIASNTIAQGDTRESGLLQLVRDGGIIYDAIKRIRWPGMASVVVSTVWVSKGVKPNRVSLDGQAVSRVTSFLVPGTIDEPPRPLSSNLGVSGKGVIPSGEAFHFCASPSGNQWPLDLALQLLDKPGYSDVLRPFWGSVELNSVSDGHPVRYVLDFGDLSETEVRSQYPELLSIVEPRLREERGKLTTQSGADRAKRYWWQHTYRAAALRDKLATLSSYLATGRVSKWLSFSFLPSRDIPSDSAVAIALDSFGAFAVLQSRPHELWARFFGSSMKDDPRYTPSDCFETFPFPQGWESNLELEAVGEEYYEYRALLMAENKEGLTITYNRFHDPIENDPRIKSLRRLHDELDRKVLAAYGWSDVCLETDFFLDYEIDEAEWGNRQKPYRYRWADDVQDEVLGRLFELNASLAVNSDNENGTTDNPKGHRSDTPNGSSEQDRMF